MDRRDFLQSLAALTAGIIIRPGRDSFASDLRRDRLGDLLPQRLLGRTGANVTMLGLGGWHVGRMSESDAQQTIEAALEGGIRFFDSAESYQRGGSESYLGRFLVPDYRDLVFVMTKTLAPNAETARQHLEGSLRRLNTDYLDLWQLHALSSAGDVDDRIGSGVLEVMEQAKAEGKVRHVGFTGHARPAAHARMLERTDLFETCQMPINAADPSYRSFTENVLPELVNRNLGVIGMKSLANGGFFGGTSMGQHGDKPRAVPDRISIQEAMHFVWSLPVSVIVSGPDDVEQIKEKIELARSFEGMGEEERRILIDRVADLAEAGLEFYKT